MEKLKDYFIKFGFIKEYSRNNVIFNEGDICNQIGLIISGEVKVVTFANSEQEIVINTLTENDLFGDLLLFSSNPYYYGVGISLNYTKIAFIDKNTLLECIRNIELLSQYLQIISDKAVLFKQINKLYAHNNLQDRVIYYLNTIMKQTHSNKIYIKSVTNLANTLSLQRPSLSRVLHRMEKENVIIFKDHYISLINKE